MKFLSTAILTATCVAADLRKESLKPAAIDDGRLKGIGFNDAGGDSSSVAGGDELYHGTAESTSSNALEMSGTGVAYSAAAAEGNVTTTGYCYSCSGGSYGCMDCSGGTYYCCSGYNICCGGSGYCASSCSSYDDDIYSDDDCFHVDTKINYKGSVFTYEELKAGKEPECTVPHSPFSKGVVISTSCSKTVRVTDTHLMATTKGFQLAYSLKAGDVLFGDYTADSTCVVTSVEKEKTTQQYFGLNCVHSEVLASGLRASTFGDFHTLPSWYMTYVGAIVGTDLASHLGEYIAEWYFQKL